MFFCFLKKFTKNFLIFYDKNNPIKKCFRKQDVLKTPFALIFIDQNTKENKVVTKFKKGVIQKKLI